MNPVTNLAGRWGGRTLIGLALASIAPIALFRLVPALDSVILSLQDAWLLLPERPYAGLANYLRLAADPRFRQALQVTLLYTLGTALPATVLGLVLAATLTVFARRRPTEAGAGEGAGPAGPRGPAGLAVGVEMRAAHLGLRAEARFGARAGLRLAGVRTLWAAVMALGFVVPSFMPAVVSATLWSWVYDPSYGLANAVLARLGVDGPAWLKDPAWALAALCLMGIWKETGLGLLVYAAALLQVPREVEDAARVDGAGSVGLWRYVRLPLLAPATAVVLLMHAVRGIELFGPVLVMTGGGPAGATASWTFYLYVTAFERYQIGYASAMAVVVGVLAVALMAGGRRWLGTAVGA